MAPRSLEWRKGGPDGGSRRPGGHRLVLLGAFDWNRLVTVETGWYEPGVFDVRSAVPRRTALGDMMRSLAARGRFEHPLLRERAGGAGSSRMHFPPVGSPELQPPPQPSARRNSDSAHDPPAALDRRRERHVGPGIRRLCRRTWDSILRIVPPRNSISPMRQPSAVLIGGRPWAVINAAGYVRVDGRSTSDRCVRENTVGAERLAAACDARAFGSSRTRRTLFSTAHGRNPIWKAIRSAR